MLRRTEKERLSKKSRAVFGVALVFIPHYIVRAVPYLMGAGLIVYGVCNLYKILSGGDLSAAADVCSTQKLSDLLYGREGKNATQKLKFAEEHSPAISTV